MHVKLMRSKGDAHLQPRCRVAAMQRLTLLLTPSAPINSLGCSTWPFDSVAMPLPALMTFPSSGLQEMLVAYNVVIDVHELAHHWSEGEGFSEEFSPQSSIAISTTLHPRYKHPFGKASASASTSSFRTTPLFSSSSVYVALPSKSPVFLRTSMLHISGRQTSSFCKM